MRVGVQYVRQSTRMHAVLVRVMIFFLQSIALLALLPLVAQQLRGGGAGTFTLLLASMGLGAIIAASQLPKLRNRLSRDDVIRWGTVLQAGATVMACLVSGLFFLRWVSNIANEAMTAARPPRRSNAPIMLAIDSSGWSNPDIRLL